MSRNASRGEIDRFFAEAVDARPGRRVEPASTDFAITTLDIPDRLDVQSARSLQSDDYGRPSRFSLTRSAAEIWFRRLLWLALLVLLGALAWLGLGAARAQLSKEAISARIAAATGLPVAIAARELVWMPTPGIDLRDVRIGSDLRVDLVKVRYSWDGLAQAISRRRILPEATVGPMQLSAEQGIALVRLGSMMRSDSGLGLGAVRFSAVTFRDMPLLSEQYEILLQPQSGRIAAPFALRQLGGRGEMRLLVSAEGNGELRFDLNAQRWAAPFASALVWDSLVAQGRAWPRGIVVESFTAKTPAAQVDGAWAAASDVQWSTAGSFQSDNADLEGVIRTLVASEDQAAFQSPLRGRASVSALGSGHGTSLKDAIDRSVFTGQVQARALTLAGVNLGLLAAHATPVQAAGGSTRFSELTADLLWTPAGLSIRDIRGQSGGMLTRGQIAVSSDLRISGSLTIDLLSVLPQSQPAPLKIGGTVLGPQFGRR